MTVTLDTVISLVQVCLYYDVQLSPYFDQITEFGEIIRLELCGILCHLNNDSNE